MHIQVIISSTKKNKKKHINHKCVSFVVECENEHEILNLVQKSLHFKNTVGESMMRVFTMYGLYFHYLI